MNKKVLRLLFYTALIIVSSNICNVKAVTMGDWKYSLETIAAELEAYGYGYTSVGSQSGRDESNLINYKNTSLSCSEYISYALQRAKVLSHGQSFYAINGYTVDKSYSQFEYIVPHNIAHIPNYDSNYKKSYHTISANSYYSIKCKYYSGVDADSFCESKGTGYKQAAPTIKELVDAGVLKAGDILVQRKTTPKYAFDKNSSHLVVYMGGGNVYAVASSYPIVNGKLVASRIKTAQNDTNKDHNYSSFQVGMIIRIKGLSNSTQINIKKPESAETPSEGANKKITSCPGGQIYRNDKCVDANKYCIDTKGKAAYYSVQENKCKCRCDDCKEEKKFYHEGIKKCVKKSYCKDNYNLASYNKTQKKCACNNNAFLHEGIKKCVKKSYCKDNYGSSKYDSNQKKCVCNSEYIYIKSKKHCYKKNYCKKTYGSGSKYKKSKEECVCKTGYFLHEGLKECKKNNYCTSNYGTGAYYNKSKKKCDCTSGYFYHEGLKECKKNNYCTSNYGTGAYYNKSKKKCDCTSGYKYNSKKKKCVKS